MKFIETNLSKKTRKMLLTINNPDKPETTPDGFLLDSNAVTDCLKGIEEAKQYIINSIRSYIDNSDIVKGKTNVYYCFSLEIGKEGTLHGHIFFDFENPRIGNKIKKIFPTAHIDYCNGSNRSVREYVFKIGKWEGNEKEDTRINGTQYENGTLPEEKGQGKRTDLEYIKELIEQGKTPKEILDTDPNFYPLETYINKMFYNKKLDDTPIKRNINVVVHTGVSGSGKSHILTTLDEKQFCLAADYSTGLFDDYVAQDILFLDEFRGQIPYNQLLIILDGYKMPIHARYNNKYSLWNNVYITSVIPFEEWYNNDNIRDTFTQLQRRVSKVVFHCMSYHGRYIREKIDFLNEYGEEAKKDIKYLEYTISGYNYTTYENLEKEAIAHFNLKEFGESEFDYIEYPTLEEEFKKWVHDYDPMMNFEYVKNDKPLLDKFYEWKIEQAKTSWRTENVA